jgi:drug/metabolite transporter (DMT)-like permease
VTPGAWLAAMIAVSIGWGAAFPLTKPALAACPPFTFTALRFALVSAILVPWAVASHYRATGRLGLGLDPRDYGRLVAAALLGYVGTQVAQNWALQLSPSTDVAIIAATQPVWIAALGALVLRERVSPIAWAGFALCAAGVIWLTLSAGSAPPTTS